MSSPSAVPWWVRLLAMLSVPVAVVTVSTLVLSSNTVAEAQPSPTVIATMAPTITQPVRAAVRPLIEVGDDKDDIRPPRETTPLPRRAAVAFPDPIVPPQPDGVHRTANVPILMYHYISTSPSPTDKIRVNLSVPPEMFEAQLQLLADAGYTTISLFDVYNHLATGQALPDKPIILTFDDGYVDNYEHAFRILKARGMVGTFFVLTAPADAGQPAYLSWPQIKEMSDAGMDIQLHAKEHVDLRGRSFDNLVWHIIGGRQSIEGHTGKPVVFMAYPSGKYDDAVLNFLKTNNFWAAVTVHNGQQHTLDNPLLWSRIRISGQASLDSFARLLGIK